MADDNTDDNADDEADDDFEADYEAAMTEYLDECLQAGRNPWTGTKPATPEDRTRTAQELSAIVHANHDSLAILRQALRAAAPTDVADMFDDCGSGDIWMAITLVAWQQGARLRLLCERCGTPHTLAEAEHTRGACILHCDGKLRCPDGTKFSPSSAAAP